MPVPTTPYDSAEAVMNRARAFGNDAILSIAGELLADTQPYVPELLNAAYEDLQDDLTVNGVETMAKELVIAGLQAVASPDPGVQANLSYTGFNNGTQNFANPTLPADMFGPLRMWERPTGTVSQFVPMKQRLDGLPSVTQTSFLRWWQWINGSSNDAIYFVGSLQQNDIKLRYNTILPALVLTPQPSQVLILRAKNALAWKVVELFCQGRGGEGAVYAGGQYTARLNTLVGRTARRKQRASARRAPWGGWRRGWRGRRG